MQRKSLRVSLVLAMTLMFLPVPTRASCVQEDLSGTWNGEIWYPGATVKENWSKFTISIDSYGKIRKGVMTYPSGKMCVITGGQLKVDGECDIQGTVQVDTQIIQISYGGIVSDNLGDSVLLLGVENKSVFRSQPEDL